MRIESLLSHLAKHKKNKEAFFDSSARKKNENEKLGSTNDRQRRSGLAAELQKQAPKNDLALQLTIGADYFTQSTLNFLGRFYSINSMTRRLTMTKPSLAG